MLARISRPQAQTGNLKTCAPARALDARGPNPPELAVVLERVKAWPGNAARVESNARRPALTGPCARRPAKVCGSGRRDGSAGGRTKGWPRLTNSFDLRKWWVRKSEYTWVRFGERRGPSTWLVWLRMRAKPSPMSSGVPSPIRRRPSERPIVTFSSICPRKPSLRPSSNMPPSRSGPCRRPLSGHSRCEHHGRGRSIAMEGPSDLVPRGGGRTTGSSTKLSASWRREWRQRVRSRRASLPNTVVATQFAVIEGDFKPHRLVIFEFPNRTNVQAVPGSLRLRRGLESSRAST
jgi:hypothetical protein